MVWSLVQPGKATMRNTAFLPRTVTVCALALLVPACGEGSRPNPAASGPAPAVTVVKVVAEDIRPTSSFTGRIEAKDKVDLRARVDGFLEKRLFTEGADVKEGDLLFVIEKGLYQAAVDEAQAECREGGGHAQARRPRGRAADRAPPAECRGAGQARRGHRQAGRGARRPAGAKAALEKAELQLGYTDIRAPIAGRIGRATVSVGNFVGPSSSALATIVSQDPIYVTFPVTQREILEIRKTRYQRRRAGDLPPARRRQPLPDPGKIDFLDVTVNQGTDTVQVRAVFPNPDRVLVDGQLVTVVAEASKGESALLVPQQALQLDQSGTFVLVVDKDNKVEVRRVEPGEARGTRIVVRKGLAAGELVITEGIQRVRPGQVVQPTEAAPGV